MLKEINGKVWFCCPQCGKKIHPAAPGRRQALQLARGVFLAERRRSLEACIKQNIREPLSL